MHSRCCCSVPQTRVKALCSILFWGMIAPLWAKHQGRREITCLRKFGQVIIVSNSSIAPAYGLLKMKRNPSGSTLPYWLSWNRFSKTRRRGHDCHRKQEGPSKVCKTRPLPEARWVNFSLRTSIGWRRNFMQINRKTFGTDISFRSVRRRHS